MTEQTTPQSDVSLQAPAIPTQPTAPGPSTFVPAPIAPPKRKRRRVMWISIAVAVAVAVALALAGTLGAIAWVATGPTEGKLVKACRKAVTQNLRSPGSAQWPGGEGVSHQDTGLWIVVGSVDAQNGFGALVRLDFECHAEREGRSWSVMDVDLDQR